MEVERRLITLDMMTSLLLALFSELTTQAAIEHTIVDASQCPQQCHHHGECVVRDDHTIACQCHKGWGGDACSVQCVKTCQNGQCAFDGQTQVCICSKGFHGDQCQHPGYDVMSFFHIAKLMSQKWDKTIPIIKNPTKDIERNIRRGSTFCSNNFQCHNGGKCRRGVFGGYRCECDFSRYTGTFCQFVCPEPCLNAGKCVRLRKTGTPFHVTLQESQTRYSCVCIDGFSGSLCQTKEDSFSHNSHNPYAAIR